MEQKRSRLITFLQKNPLSTVREVSVHFNTHKVNYTSTKKLIQRLEDAGVISAISRPKSYYVEPKLGSQKQLLIDITKSEKIFLPRFKKLSYKDVWMDEITSQIVLGNCIHLFHLQLKNHLLKTQKKLKRKLSKQKKQKEIKKFHKNFSKFLKTYKEGDQYVGFIYSLEKDLKKNHPEWTKPKSKKEGLKRISDFIFFHYYYDKQYFNSLAHGQIPVSGKFDRISFWMHSGSKTEASEKFRVTNKALQRAVEGFLGNRGQFNLWKVFFHEFTEINPETRTRQRKGKFQKIMLQSLAKSLLDDSKLKNKKVIIKQFEKRFGVKVSDLIDSNSFDT